MGKVLIYAMQEGHGGIEQYVLNLSRFCKNPQDKYGYIIIGQTTVFENDLKKYGVDYFFVTHKNSSIKKNCKELNRLFKEKRNEYDTVYFNTSGLFYPVPYLLARKYNYKIDIHSHLDGAMWSKRWIHLFNRAWILKISKSRLACSSSAGKWMFGNKDFELVSNAIELDRFIFNEQIRNEYRKKYSLEHKFVVGNIGRLTYFKNQKFLVDILIELKKKCDAVLILVGDGEDYDALSKRVSENGLEGSVIFAGKTERPEIFYSVFDCFVMTSISEGFPIALVEAQANGLPCVISDNITPEVNITGNITFCSLKDKHETWADKILEKPGRYNGYDTLVESGFDVNVLEERVWELLYREKRSWIGYE